MKSDTPFNGLKLYDTNGREVAAGNLPDDFQAEFQEKRVSFEDQASEKALRVKGQWVALLTISIVCSIAAVTTGICAALIVRKKEAVDGLTDVRDILEECQTRMQKLESDLSYWSPSITETN